MALTKNNPAAKFENPDDDNGEAGDQTQALSADERVAAQAAKNAARSAAAPAAAAPAAAAPAAASVSQSREVAAAPAANLAVSVMQHNPLAACKNALHVDYDTLTQIMVTNGNVALKETKELLGDHVGLEVISFQDQWVCSPGGDSKDEESKEFLKFSDDGVYVRGTDQLLTEAVKLARDAGYDKADVKKRMTLVGALIYPGRDKKGNVVDELQDELVQIDLAPRSKSNFEAYQVNAAFKVSRNLLDPQAALRVCMYAKVQSKGDNNWTDADFRPLVEADYLK